MYGGKAISLEHLLEHYALEQITDSDKNVFILDGIPYVLPEKED